MERLMYLTVNYVPWGTMEDKRRRVRTEKGITGLIRAIGEKHDLDAPDAYGKALEFTTANQSDFEDWLADNK